MTTEQKQQYYKNKYFIGQEANGKTQLLHFNKRGYELRNAIFKNVVIFSNDNMEHTIRFNSIADGPFKFCYKIPANEYLFGLTDKKENWLKKLLNAIINRLKAANNGRNL